MLARLTLIELPLRVLPPDVGVILGELLLMFGFGVLPIALWNHSLPQKRSATGNFQIRAARAAFGRNRQPLFGAATPSWQA